MRLFGENLSPPSNANQQSPFVNSYTSSPILVSQNAKKLTYDSPENFYCNKQNCPSDEDKSSISSSEPFLKKILVGNISPSLRVNDKIQLELECSQTPISISSSENSQKPTRVGLGRYQSFNDQGEISTPNLETRIMKFINEHNESPIASYRSSTSRYFENVFPTLDSRDVQQQPHDTDAVRCRRNKRIYSSDDEMDSSTECRMTTSVRKNVACNVRKRPRCIENSKSLNEEETNINLIDHHINDISIDSKSSDDERPFMGFVIPPRKSIHDNGDSKLLTEDLERRKLQERNDFIFAKQLQEKFNKERYLTRSSSLRNTTLKGKRRQITLHELIQSRNKIK